MKRSSLSKAVAHLKEQRRKGVFFVLAIISLMAAMTFVGMSVDLGMITVTKTRMQASADAAALAAAQEIVIGIRTAAEQGESDMQTIQAIAAAAAKTMAVRVADLNGFYIDPAIDVSLGNRLLNEDGVTYTETYGTPPYNMVKVEIRKTNEDPSQADAKLPLIFAPVVGERAQSIRADAVAFIESRDIVAVLDYSGSMAFDSQFRSDTVNRLGLTGVTDGLDDIWDALVASDVRFSDEASTPKFPAEGFGNINSYAGTYISSRTTSTIFDQLDLGGTGGGVRFYDYDNYSTLMMELGVGTYDLNNMSGNVDDDINSFEIPAGYTVTLWDFSNEGGWQSGPHTSDVSSLGGYSNDAEWIVITSSEASDDYVPFPQEGKDGSGNLNGKPSRNESESLWNGYISYVKNNLSSYGYRKDYGYRTLMQYLISQKKANNQSEDLWRAPIYPHHGMKEGVTMLATFLNNLGYGDHLGLVTYATTSRIETGLWEDGADVTVDLIGEHLTDNVMAIDTIQRHKQAGHYNSATGIGYGLEDARDLLDDQGRYGAQKAILLMTDGQSNQYPSGYGTGSLPAGWIWNDITDFDGDGSADVIIDSSYVSGGNGDGNWRAALHSFVRAKEAFDAGYTVHTISMGDGADTTLMNAIAEMSGGEYVHIASGTSNAQMEIELEGAFAVMAGQVPPARLLVDGD
ncbi:MAG TPA: VWA domain-containing protein [Planctomycetes bacterium]|nr:VWA domain-containing protein [Fuerstiella sp.]HIK94601.1 VWA domain-containing protein [Planctomycetota bacterium]